MTFTHNFAPTQFIEVAGVRYAYRSFGKRSGTPIVLLAHFRAGMDNWDPVVTDGLAEHHPVILFNNAGVSSSGGEPAHSVAEMAQHVIAFVKAMGLTEVNILGFSLGGFVAQRVAVDGGELVHRLILAGTGPEGGERMNIYLPEVERHATQAVPTEDNFLYLFFSPSEKSQAAGRAFWNRRHERVGQDTPSSVAAMIAQADAIGAWGKVPEHDRYSYLKQIKQRTFVVNGDNDIMVPSINSFILKTHIPRATLSIFPDAGHGAIFQYPDLFVSEALDFLAEG